MQGRAPTEDQVAALVAYLKTLAAPPKLVDSAEGAVAARIRQGQKLFQSLDCQRCHTAPTYTSPKVYDVGLKDQVGNKKFNPPSLRGVGRRESFFHDARATSLIDVLTKHKHQLNRKLSAAELKNLVQFLKSL
jgi:cytochrome c peroxidase